MSAEIDTEAWVTSLARAICEADGGCACQAEDGVACEDRETQARAAISHLLPLIVERCAAEAEAEANGNDASGRLLKWGEAGSNADPLVGQLLAGHVIGAARIAADIRALLTKIESKGGDHA